MKTKNHDQPVKVEIGAKFKTKFHTQFKPNFKICKNQRKLRYDKELRKYPPSWPPKTNPIPAIQK